MCHRELRQERAGRRPHQFEVLQAATDLAGNFIRGSAAHEGGGRRVRCIGVVRLGGDPLFAQLHGFARPPRSFAGTLAVLKAIAQPGYQIGVLAMQRRLAGLTVAQAAPYLE